MPYQGLSLEGQTALVTGSGRGIGAALAIGLAQAGAAVAVSDRPDRLDLAESTKSKVVAEGVKSGVYPLDVLDIPGIPKVIDQVVEDFGHLDILVNNAGIRIPKPALEVTEEDWTELRAPEIDSVESMIAKAGPGVVFCGEGVWAHKSAMHGLVARSVTVLSMPPPTRHASALGELGFQRFIEGRYEDPGQLEPLYLRRPNITYRGERKQILGKG